VAAHNTIKIKDLTAEYVGGYNIRGILAIYIS
jgi:hypothetical protein